MAQLIHVRGQFDEQDARNDAEFEHDILVADGMFQLLPEDELSHILRATETSLRESAVWLQVDRLADALVRLDDVGRGLNEYLPEPRADWMQGLAPDGESAGPRNHA